MEDFKNGTDTNNQDNGTGADNQENKTFTQEEVDAIVLKRLGKEKAKFADYETLKEKAEKYDEAQNAGKSELEKMTDKFNELQLKYDSMVKADELSKMRASVSKETGVPEHLLSGDTEETCKAQAKAILEFAKPTEYPGVKKTKSIDHKSSETDDAMREFAHQLFNK